MKASIAVYFVFDSMMAIFLVQKIETIGDQYKVRMKTLSPTNLIITNVQVRLLQIVRGIPIRACFNHAEELGTMALKLLEEFHIFSDKFSLRIKSGIHSGW